MGEVYLAQDTKLGRKVALKFLSPEFVGDNWAKRQLMREAQAVAMLDHPNICPVYGIEEHEGHSFIVMQFVEGETLADMIRAQPLSAEQVLPLAQQIVGALAEAHSHGIIHRDIKPRNIMVTNTGQARVLDFGLAKTVHQKGNSEALADSISHLSQAGIVPGTVAYMSPEQLRAEKLDYRSDIFSLGTVLYEMVAGRNPFARESTAETISAILTQTPKPTNQGGPASARALDLILQRCHLKDRDERYQSASEMLLELDNLDKGIVGYPRWQTYLSLRPGAILALVLLFVVAAAIAYSRWTGNTHSIAILPVTCEGITSSACPGPGITQGLITRLSRRSDFVIRASDATPSLFGANAVSAQTIGKQLGVEAVLRGRIFKRGELLILQTRLESVIDGSKLSENEYVLPSQTVPLLEELSLRMAFNPESPPTEDEKKSFQILAAFQNRNPEAVELYLRGLYYWNKRDRDNVLKAIDLFNQAIDRDPVYALAYSGLANCYVVMSSVAYGTLSTKDAMDRASAAARKALEIDPNLAEAHTSLGIVQMKYDWNWREAEKSFKRAIELKADYPLAHYWYSSLLGTTGRMDEAIAESEKAKALDPLSPLFITNLGRAYYRARDYDKAIDYLTRVLAENPNNTSAMYVLAHAYFQKGMYSESINLLEKISATNKWLAAAPLGYAYAKAGRIGEARKILAEMEALPKSENLPAQERAIIYIGLCEKDNAFLWLEKSYQDHFASIIGLTTDPIFDSLRSDPRLLILAHKINLTL
jgi:tetratricopeptide (TPR) repeat protein/predicted Ser/Thr protein kinase